MNKKLILGIAAFVFVGLLAAGFVAAMPFDKGFGQGLLEEDQMNAMQEAIASGDYNSWKALMQEQITEEHFNELVEMHAQKAEFRIAMQEARESGDFSKIQELKEEFGMGNHMGKGFGKMNSGSGSCNK